MLHIALTNLLKTATGESNQGPQRQVQQHGWSGIARVQCNGLSLSKRGTSPKAFRLASPTFFADPVRAFWKAWSCWDGFIFGCSIQKLLNYWTTFRTDLVCFICFVTIQDLYSVILQHILALCITVWSKWCRSFGNTLGDFHSTVLNYCN